MARKPSTPPPRPADWTPDQTYAALKKQLASLDNFRSKTYREVEHQEQEWMNLTVNILTHGFGEKSNNVNQFHQAKWAGQHHVNMDDWEVQRNFDQRIQAFAAMLSGTVAELELMGAGSGQIPAVSGGTAGVKSNSRDAFLVHGRDETMQQSVARFLEKLDLRPVILHEQPNMGRTLIEKFEAHSDVGFAIVLLTPDDVGGLASEGKLNPRARQNVIMELGYFIGKLSRARFCALYVEHVELPSDIHGVLYVPYDGSNGWRLKLAHEIRAAGISVDLNRT